MAEEKAKAVLAFEPPGDPGVAFGDEADALEEAPSGFSELAPKYQIRLLSH